MATIIHVTASQPGRSLTRTLPPELLTRVCQFVEFMDLKALRLVDRTLSQIAMPGMYETVYMILLPRSMNRVQKIGRHPDLAHHVRKIAYFGDSFDTDFEEKCKWKENALQFAKENNLDVKDIITPTHFNQFRLLSWAQSALLKDGHEARFLSWVGSAPYATTERS